MASQTGNQSSQATATTADLGEKEVQQRVDKEQEQGFVGVEVDPTPNQNYTVSGVTKGLPTPETDESAAAKARTESGFR